MILKILFCLLQILNCRHLQDEKPYTAAVKRMVIERAIKIGKRAAGYEYEINKYFILRWQLEKVDSQHILRQK